MASPARIRSGFNFLAPFYDILAGFFFAGSLRRAQNFFLPQLAKHRRVLIAGGGRGQILVELMDRGIGGHYTYVDISEKMVAAAAARLRRREAGFLPVPAAEVEFICAPLESLSERHFDLVITPFVLDCFGDEKLPTVMQGLASLLAPKGIWLFTDFHIPQTGMRLLSRIIIRALYFLFHVVCGLGIKKLPAFERHFGALGLTAAGEKFFLNGLVVSRIYKKSAIIGF